MQERASRTRRIILEAAAETFEARGYAATSLQDIASRMAASKGALYFHFPSKEEVALAVINESYDLWPTAIARLRQQYSRAIRILLELSWEMTYIARESVMMRAGVRLVLERNLIGPTVPRLFIDWISAIDELLQDTRDQGDLLPNVDTESTASFIVASFAGYQHLTEVREGRDSKYCVNTMWRYLLPGLVNSECLTEMQKVFDKL